MSDCARCLYAEPIAHIIVSKASDFLCGRRQSLSEFGIRDGSTYTCCRQLCLKSCYKLVDASTVFVGRRFSCGANLVHNPAMVQLRMNSSAQILWNITDALIVNFDGDRVPIKGVIWFWDEFNGISLLYLAAKYNVI
eukprot:m.240497 g.240497  ORF g.240497 m.240497 type:complete len:137 (+) comp19414_c0_seq29:152-562(+)